jgi:uncharacterized repeat protein (TIGR03803 family)
MQEAWMSRIVSCSRVLGTGLLLAMLAPAGTAGAKSTETVLYRFKGGSDGGTPAASLILDKKGNLYGTTSDPGTVFRIAPDGRETVLHYFQGGHDGETPQAPLIADTNGSLYGTTAGGGKNGYGTVFKLAADGTETVLYAFKGGSDGIRPAAGLVEDGKGTLYGTTAAGGGSDLNCGIVFKLDSGGAESIIYAFQGDQDGCNPTGTLLRDAKGKLYGTTLEGGITNGMIFRLSPRGTKTVLYQFKGSNDGRWPEGAAMDSSGNLYVTTQLDGAGGYGTVVKLYTSGTFIVLHGFASGGDGAYPNAAPIVDSSGNVYGTTLMGGRAICSCGTVFKIKRDGKETVLHAFHGGRDGSSPVAALIEDANGILYGTTSAGGGDNAGTVFKITQ